MFDVFSASDVRPLSKFKIPKKKRPDSESNSNASLYVKDEPSSDSEPELRIAESETEETDVQLRYSTTSDDNDSTMTKTEETNLKTNHEDDDAEEKRQKLIKEKLNEMVGSLAPDEARKLLERVGSNQNKLTLEQLKSMLHSSDSGEGPEHNVSPKEEITSEGENKLFQNAEVVVNETLIVEICYMDNFIPELGG